MTNFSIYKNAADLETIGSALVPVGAAAKRSLEVIRASIINQQQVMKALRGSLTAADLFMKETRYVRTR
jgi:hypothetical protein